MRNPERVSHYSKPCQHIDITLYKKLVDKFEKLVGKGKPQTQKLNLGHRFTVATVMSINLFIDTSPAQALYTLGTREFFVKQLEALKRAWSFVTQI